MKKPKVILFDWDNTLVSTWDLIHKALNYTLHQQGREPWTLDYVKAHAQRSAREYFPVLFPDTYQKAFKDFYGYVNAHHLKEVKPFESTEPLLTLLKEQNIKAGLVSNKAKAVLAEEVQFLSYNKYFNVVIGAGDAPFDKPHKAPIDLALHHVNETHDSCWFVGDTAVDMDCAHNAGVKAVFIGELDRQNDYSFKELSDFYKFIKKLF